MTFVVRYSSGVLNAVITIDTNGSSAVNDTKIKEKYFVRFQDTDLSIASVLVILSHSPSAARVRAFFHSAPLAKGISVFILFKESAAYESLEQRYKNNDQH